jgi:hypothetical protein
MREEDEVNATLPKPGGSFLPPRHIVWSADRVDLADPFQRRWYIRQVLLHGRAQDVRALNLDEVAVCLDDLNLPPDLDRLWRTFLKVSGHAQG